MQRFSPVVRSETLPNKAICPSARTRELRISAVLGMDEGTRAALERIELLAKSRKIAVAGRFMPDSGVSQRLAALGIAEDVEEADFFKFRSIVIPYGGISARQRRVWQVANYPLEDLASPFVRRAQTALGLLKLEGAQPLVIGRHEDAESLAIADGTGGARILENTTDTARLLYAPAFGVVSQTTLSPRRVSWLVQQLRHRWNDARVMFLDTVSPAMAAREEALERLLVACDRVVIVGEAGESSCEALAETALRRGRSAAVVATPGELDALDFATHEKVALSAGAFATDEAIRAVAEALA